MKSVYYFLFLLLFNLKVCGVNAPEAYSNRTLKTNPSTSFLEFPFGKINPLFYTGSMIQITSEAFDKRALTNFLKALEGKGSGMQFTSGFGQPGMTPDISIRGYDADDWIRTPLFVINGMPTSLQLSNINPQDIESITVLKDAVTSSLYGGRSTSGVILIQTQKQAAPNGFLDLKLNQGMSLREIPTYEKLNINAYLPAFREAAAKMLEIPASRFALTNAYFQRIYALSPFTAEDLVSSDGTLNPEAQLLHPEDCNWEDALLRTANRTDLTLATGYGNRWASLYLSGNLLTEEGYLIETGLKRYTGYASVDLYPLKWFQAGITAHIASSTYKLREYGRYTENNLFPDFIPYGTNPFLTINTIAPWIPIHQYDEKGNFEIDEKGNQKYYFPRTNFRNVVEEMRNNSNKWKNQEQLYTFFIEFVPLQGFNLRAQYSFEHMDDDKKGFNRYYFLDFSPLVETDTIDHKQKNRALDISASYQFIHGKHALDILIGYNSYKSESRRNSRFYALANDDDNNPFPTSSKGYVKGNSTYTSRSFIYKGQVNYHYNQKYFITASYTKDVFKTPKNFNNRKDFYTTGIAWRIGEEKFLKKQNRLKELKWRASFGKGYNYGLNIPLNTLYFQSSTTVYTPRKERINHWNIGIDFNLQNRLKGSLEYYSKTHKGYLANSLSDFKIIILGNGSPILVNNWYGKMINSGWEISLNAQVIQAKKFHWNMGLHLTFPRNEIDYLKGKSEAFNKERTGHPRSAFILHKYQGVPAQTGEGIYESNASYCGSPIPDFYGTIDHRLGWKNLELSFLFAFQKGGKVLDQTYCMLMTPGMTTAFHPDIQKRWQKPGDQASVPRMTHKDEWPVRQSDRWLTDASYLALKSLTLSWDFPEKWLKKIKLSQLTFYANGENLFLISKRKGMDPQQNFNGNIESIYGPARILSLGIHIGI